MSGLIGSPHTLRVGVRRARQTTLPLRDVADEGRRGGAAPTQARTRQRHAGAVDRDGTLLRSEASTRGREGVHWSPSHRLPVLKVGAENRAPGRGTRPVELGLTILED